jgi:hypothetical protein
MSGIERAMLPLTNCEKRKETKKNVYILTLTRVPERLGARNMRDEISRPVYAT